MIQAINALLRAILGEEPQRDKAVLYREDTQPGEWLDCRVAVPPDGEVVEVATRETYPEKWGRAMKAFGLNGWMLRASSSTLPVGEPVAWRYE